MTTGYNRDRCPLDPPSLQELLDCLATHPEGTQGRAIEEAQISALHSLCLEHGFGRVAELVDAIDAIWRKTERGHRLLRLYAGSREFIRQLPASADGTTDTTDTTDPRML